MSRRICVIEGDGVGREVVPIAVEILSAVEPTLEFVPATAGWDTFQRQGQALPDETLDTVRNCGVAIFGACSSPSRSVKGYRSPIIYLRQNLGLYACLRPVISLPLPTCRPGVDLLIVRENTEGLYVGREETDGELATASRIVTRQASARIARFAFELACRQNRHRLTVVHKANVLPLTCGLFRTTALEISHEYPEIAVDEMLVDVAAMYLAKEPGRFDVILTTNLFGDILSDEASVWGGGIGMAASLNIGSGLFVAEPVHGSAPNIAGRDQANPIAAILSGALLLRYAFGMEQAAKRIERAVSRVLEDGYRTMDLVEGDQVAVGTREMGRYVIARLCNE